MQEIQVEYRSMKKILILASAASMVEQFNMHNINLLLEMGVQTDVAANFKKGNTCTDREIDALKTELEEKGVAWHQIDFDRNALNLPACIRAYRQVAALLKENQYAVIHCHSPIGGAVGRAAGHFKGKKVIYTAHGFHFFKGAGIINWLLYFPVEKFLAGFTDILITMNREDFQNAEKFCFKAGKITCFEPVGVNIHKYGAVDGKIKRKLREKYGFHQDDFILIFPGEFNHRKNQDFLIRTLAFLKKSIASVHLVLPGKGKYLEKCRKLAVMHGVWENVHFTGFCPFGELVERYQASDLFVSASRQEGLPKNLKEAMACGLPAAVSDIRGNQDLIVDKKGGFLYAAGNENDYASAVLELYKNTDARYKMGAYNLKRIQKFSTQRAVEKMRAVYRECLF